MTPARLEEIRATDAKVNIHSDKYGGKYVLRGDQFKHGGMALTHRRELLEHIAYLEKMLSLEIWRQASVIAYDNAFTIGCILSLSLMPLLLLIRAPKRNRQRRRARSPPSL